MKGWGFRIHSTLHDRLKRPQTSYAVGEGGGDFIKTMKTPSLSEGTHL